MTIFFFLAEKENMDNGQKEKNGMISMRKLILSYTIQLVIANVCT